MIDPVVVDEIHVSERHAELAARAVSLALRSARYQADEEGLPVDARLRDAVISSRGEQVRALRELDAQQAAITENAALSPLGIPLSSASIGGASYSAAEGGSAVQSALRIPESGGLCPAAYDVLLAAGLLGHGVGIYG